MEEGDFNKAVLRWIASAASVFALFLTFRVAVPGLMNSQHDSAIILAILVGFAVPAAIALFLYQVWKGEVE